jgi:hypothetical protein
MVTLFSTARWALAAAEAKRPLIERLDARTRIAMLSALLGILLVGLVMLVMISLGGRFVRRVIRRRPRSVPPGSATVREPAADNPQPPSD